MQYQLAVTGSTIVGKEKALQEGYQSHNVMEDGVVEGLGRG
jgi:hypothetical protein